MGKIKENLIDISASSTLAINELSKSLENEGNEIFKFGLGQSPFPIPIVIVEELKKNAYQKDYLNVSGLLGLRESVAKYHSKLNKHLVIVPIAFVSEHSETLVELDIEYEKLAKKNGCSNYTRIEALGANENFIDGLSDLILNKDDYKLTDNLCPPKNRCPSNFSKCPCLN